MSMLELFGYENLKSRAMSWWDSKSEEEQLELETWVAIIGPGLGSMLGIFLADLLF